MKVRITMPSGAVADAEGTPEECARFAGLVSPQQLQFIPSPIWVVPTPEFIPTPNYEYTIGTWPNTYPTTTITMNGDPS